MHPAFSVIFLTTLIGAGQGLFLALFTAQVREAEANVAKSKATLVQAEDEFQRNQPLFDKGFLSAREFLPVRIGIDTAKAGLAAAEASLARAKELASKLVKTDQPPLLDTRGWVHYRVGEYDKAVEVLTNVVKKAPDVAVFNYHLGMAYLKQGNGEAAKKYLSKAVDEKSAFAGVEEARQVLEELNR